MKPPVQILLIPQGYSDIIVLWVLFRVFEMISLSSVADNHLTERPSITWPQILSNQASSIAMAQFSRV